MEKLDVNVSKYYTVTGNPSRAILFQGIVKNKSELVKLLKMLGINE